MMCSTLPAGTARPASRLGGQDAGREGDRASSGYRLVRVVGGDGT